MKLISAGINDLNSSLGVSHSRGNNHEELNDVYRQTDFFAGHRTHASPAEVVVVAKANVRGEDNSQEIDLKISSSVSNP